MFSREEIFEGVWEGRAVVDETLTRSVYLLRQALGDDAGETQVRLTEREALRPGPAQSVDPEVDRAVVS